MILYIFKTFQLQKVINKCKKLHKYFQQFHDKQEKINKYKYESFLLK